VRRLLLIGLAAAATADGSVLWGWGILWRLPAISGRRHRVAGKRASPDRFQCLAPQGPLQLLDAGEGAPVEHPPRALYQNGPRQGFDEPSSRCFFGSLFSS
jgi:hypothetical protein